MTIREAIFLFIVVISLIMVSLYNREVKLNQRLKYDEIQKAY